MRIFQSSVSGAAFLAALVTIQIHGQTGTIGSLTGQWDFNQGNLKATTGTDLRFVGQMEASTTFETVVINGQNGNVMRISPPSDGILLFHGAQPNGGGTNVNNYTLLMDILWPAESDGTFRALFNSDTNNVQDPIMFVNPDNAVGVNNDYSGLKNVMNPETWYRLALAFDLQNSKLSKYLNGELVGEQTLDAGVDSRYSLRSALLLFASNSGEVSTALIDRIQFYSNALTSEEVKGLGTPIGDGGPPVSGDVKIDSITKVGAEVEIAISGGGTLQLQRKASLTSTTWQPVGQVTGSGTIKAPAAERTGFFRVQRL